MKPSALIRFPGMSSLRSLILGWMLLIGSSGLKAQSPTQSPARIWMDALMLAIPDDAGRPTVQARNIFHLALGMYDAWAAYEPDAEPVFLGKSLGDFECPFDPDFELPSNNIDSLQEIAVSFAAYRILFYRFNLTATKGRVIDTIRFRFEGLGYDENYRSQDYHNGKPEALGNYVAQMVIDMGMVDGSNEEDNHDILNYQPVNRSLRPDLPGVQGLHDPNHWQPVSIGEYLEKRGGDPSVEPWVLIGLTVEDVFLSPEWGQVIPFSLGESNCVEKEVDSYPMNLCLDPGPPPRLDYDKDSIASEQYKWGFLTVLLWSSLLDPSDSVRIDISPGVQGNAQDLPAGYADFPMYYDQMGGKVRAKGYKKNPQTGQPYAPNIVLRGDYLRVIAEYWVDGVNTVTPPGHWILNLNYVTDRPGFKKRWGGKGPELDDLEWDVKSYLVMGGAMHDAAIVSWGAKGYYDYVRPITAIRYMATQGQCSDPELPHYHREGMPLIPGRIELVEKGDPLAGPDNEHLHKIKVYAWRGPEYVEDYRDDFAGVGWILGENWWPYQRYSFATPPFAGYISGHSTFSPAGAEVLTLITGDPFFPGGLGTYSVRKHEFLEFEDGPTEDITLQWATYHDAAAETCLSRIYGGIHPPCDDIPARKAGIEVARKAFAHAGSFFK